MKNVENCGHSAEYKAIRQPTCGCRACWTKWNTRPPVEIITAAVKSGGNDLDPVATAEEMKAKHAALENLPTRAEEAIPEFLIRKPE